jgi:hypothetical protein
VNATVRKSGKLALRFTCVTMIEINFHLDNMTDMICHRIMCNQFCLTYIASLFAYVTGKKCKPRERKLLYWIILITK